MTAQLHDEGIDLKYTTPGHSGINALEDFATKLLFGGAIAALVLVIVLAIATVICGTCGL